MRRASTLLVPALLAAACATGGGTDPALVEAGRLQRRLQPPPAAAELRREVDSFHDTELPLLQEEVDRRLARKARTLAADLHRGGGPHGAGRLLGDRRELGRCREADPRRRRSRRGHRGGRGLGARVAGAAACRTFLDSAREDVDSWRRNAIPPGEGPVAPAVWAAWVDRVAAVRSHESCRQLR